MANEAFLRAIEFFKGQTGLARRLTEVTGKDVTQQRIWNILNRQAEVPAEWCIPIERATEGTVTRHQLRPDLYPIEHSEPESITTERPSSKEAAA